MSELLEIQVLDPEGDKERCETQQRLATLEATVATLRQEVAALRERGGDNAA